MAEFTSVRVGQLAPLPFSSTDLVPHEVGGVLYQGTIQQMATTIGAIIGVSASVGFRAVQVNDGDTLPDTTQEEFILVGTGTFQNVGGGDPITTTGGMNALVSNGTYWFIGVEIPIPTVEISSSPDRFKVLLTSNPQEVEVDVNFTPLLLTLNALPLDPDLYEFEEGLLTINYPDFDPNGLDEIWVYGTKKISELIPPIPVTPLENIEIKMIKVSNIFIQDNFDGTGLGILTMVGYAICNGSNGTISIIDSVPMGWSIASGLEVGDVVGSNEQTLTNAKLPPLSVTLKKSVNTSGGSGDSFVCNLNNNAGNQTIDIKTGVAQPISMLQKSTIVLYIQKI